MRVILDNIRESFSFPAESFRRTLQHSAAPFPTSPLTALFATSFFWGGLQGVSFGGFYDQTVIVVNFRVVNNFWF